jgi:glycosidase
MRSESAALRRGDRRTVHADHEVYVYERTAGDETVTVALNFSDSPQQREVGGRSIELGPLGSEVFPLPAGERARVRGGC